MYYFIIYLDIWCTVKCQRSGGGLYLKPFCPSYLLGILPNILVALALFDAIPVKITIIKRSCKFYQQRSVWKKVLHISFSILYEKKMQICHKHHMQIIINLPITSEVNHSRPSLSPKRGNKNPERILIKIIVWIET